jgi:alkylation response protein AidB-like acyl-CoA dehydrogenase
MALDIGRYEAAPGEMVDEELVLAAAALVEPLRERAATAESLRRLPDETVEDLERSGLLRLTVPVSRGGYQVSPATFLRVITELARGCASTSFVTTVYAGVPFLVSLFPDEAQDEVFASPNPKVINTFNPGGGTARTEGGFVLSGRWPFCTGQHHADWAIMSALTTNDDDIPEVGFFLVPRSEFTSEGDWDVTGLVASGSDTLVLPETFVPAHRRLLVSDLLAGRFTSSVAAADPYYQVPVLAYCLAGLAGVPVGLASTALDLFLGRISRRGITYTSYLRQADATVTHLQAAEASMKLDQAIFHADRLVATATSATADLDLATRARCRADTAWAVRLGREVVDIVQAASGASAIHRKDPLQRLVRDMHAYSVHSLLLFNTNAELYGRVLCGVDPGSPFI